VVSVGYVRPESSGQQETRSRVAGQAYGRTLEIGADNGCNLAHYTEAVTELVVTEPMSHTDTASADAVETADPVDDVILVRLGQPGVCG
jgi:hypothetical protein